MNTVKKKEYENIISVIVPYYNNPTIYECLDSILSQTGCNIEMIVADDGSDTDQSEEIKKYILNRQRDNIKSVQILRSETNEGTVRNINKAIHVIHGDPIITLSADDTFSDSEALRDWADAFTRYDADVVIGHRRCCDEHLNPGTIAPNRKMTALLKSRNNQRIWKQLCRDNFIFGCATARSARCVEQYGFIPEEYRLIEDYPMNLRWFRSGARVFLTDRIVVNHRAGGVSHAENVNSQYIADTRKIYENEVFPYVKCKWIWKLHLERMIHQRIRLGRYQMMRKHHDSLTWNILCHLLYPEVIIRYINTRIEKKQTV